MSSRSSELYPAPVADFSAIHQRDLLALAPDDQERELLSFQTRLQNWAGRTAAMPAADGPTVSVEIPVFKGGWIIPAVESVLYQTSAAWTLSLRWDEGDELSRRALEAMHALRHPRILVHFGENLGIARTRRFLTEHSTGDYILPLDDDDMLAPEAIETFLAFTRERPWSGIVRARRDFIDGLGNRVQADPWFAFEPRHYQHGMVQDVANHCQPMLISRAAYARTAGWEGFEEFRFAGEDCDIFIKIEEVAPIELLDSILYYYRLSDRRTSLVITDTAAYEMWRRLADRSIARIGLPLTRTNDRPPFTYQRQPRTQPSRDAVDFVVFHVESADVENLTGSPADATIRSLGTCGVGDEAIHVVAPPLVGAPARNEGARRTRRPFICFVKAGTEIESDALTSLLHHMDARESDLVAPRVLAPDGAMACAAPAFTDQRTPTLRGEGAPHRDRYHSVVDAGWLPSTCLLVRREVMNAVGGFDQERAEMIADADFALKARRRDFTCTYVGAASVVDRGGASTGASSADNDWLRAKWNDDARLWQPLDFGSAGADYMTLYERGNALLREGNVETAIAAFRTVSAINSNFSWAYHSLGDALFQVERWAEAVDAYTDAIARKPDVPWSHLHRGNALNKLERWSDALDAYARAIELDPAIASAHGSSAHVLLRLGRWQDALSAFDKAATLDAGDFWLHYGRGDALAGLERWDEAVTAYDRAIALRSDVPWAFHHRGDSLAQLDRLEEAASAYRSAIALDPSMSASHTELGNVLFRLDQFREAVAEYDRAIAIDSNDFWAHYGRGDALSSPSLERWTEAIDAYERANAIRADEFWSYFNLGQAHTRLKHWDRAVTAFTQATRLNPSHARAHWKLGGVLTEAGDFEAAVSALQIAVELEPHVSASYGSLGNALFQIGRWEQSIAAYEQAVALDAEVAWYRTNLGNAFVRLEKYADAVGAYQRAVELLPDAADAHADLGHALSKTERWEEAVTSYGRSAELDPRPFWTHHYLGYALLRLARWEGAAAAFSRAIAIDAGFCWSHHHLGNALAKLDHWADASESFRRALDLEPEMFWSANNLGEMLAKLEEWDGARHAFERALALRPDFAPAVHNLGDVMLHLGRLDDASEWYQRADKAFPAWSRANIDPAVQALEQWIERLAAGVSPAGHGGGERLLFVFDTDYGELTTAMYTLLGQPLAASATLLLPPRLFVNNGDILPGRTHSYRSIEDVLQAVDDHTPDVVVIASGYLFSIHEICSPEMMRELVARLTARGCLVVTTDPFLGLLSSLGTTTHISIDIPAHASPHEVRLKREQDVMLIEHFTQAVATFGDVDHLYPVYPAGPGDTRPATGVRRISSFNDSLLLDNAMARGALADDTPIPAVTEAGKPLWVFVLASRDYELQAAFFGKVEFADLLIAKLEETLQAGRHPVLIAPYSCVRAIVANIDARKRPLAGDVTITTFCSFKRFSALLLGAEYAFYWNALSHSMFLRLFNQRPTFLFDRGHLVRNVTPLYEHIVCWYYQGWDPVYLDPLQPLTAECLTEPAEAYRQGACRIHSLLRRSPSPVHMVNELRHTRLAGDVTVSG